MTRMTQIILISTTGIIIYDCASIVIQTCNAHSPYCLSNLQGFVTFGSFNALAKITPQVVALWARLLLAVPNSRLLLKNKPSACPLARRHFLSQVQPNLLA